MAEIIPVDLTKTGGALIPPGTAFTEEKISTDKIKDIKPKEPEAQKPEDKKEEVKICKHCGMDPVTSPIEPTFDDIWAFQQAVWKDDAFKKAFTLFGGSIKVTFRTLTPFEEDVIRTQLNKEKIDGKTLTPYEMYERAISLRLPLLIDKLTIGEKDKTPVVKDTLSPEQLVVLFEDFKNSFKQFSLYQSIRDVSVTFHMLVVTIERRANDSSFFPATVPSGDSHVLR